jgi:hypothetical protein
MERNAANDIALHGEGVVAVHIERDRRQWDDQFLAFDAVVVAERSDLPGDLRTS